MNRPDDPISCEPGKMRDGDHSSLVVRFVAGAAASVLARLVALTAGPVVSGAFLAFPAILAASLALVAKEEQRDEAREDAAGTILGGAAMSAFAGIAVGLLGHLAPGLVLALAWVVTAVGLYFLIGRRLPVS
ncbi:MAG: DUF3147 family protein [Solirubrobacteraceae bacterium]